MYLFSDTNILILKKTFRMPEKIIIADTSCLITLDNIEDLSLLKKIFTNITITPQVADEFGKELASWIEVENVTDVQKIRLLELELDLGEASSIALALEKPNSLLIIDERKGREIAKKLEVKIIGLLGILIIAKRKSFINNLSAYFDKIENVGFRISEKLKTQILLQEE